MYAGGWKAAGRLVVVFAHARAEGWRLGITATRRTGGAVVRNRARRRIRELARRHTCELAALGADVVVNVRQGCSEAPWAELEKDFVECLTRLRRRLGRREP